MDECKALSPNPQSQNRKKPAPYRSPHQGLTLAHFRAQLEDLRDTSLTLELNLSTLDTSTGQYGIYGGQSKLKLSGKGQSKLKLSGNGNECKPLAHTPHGGSARGQGACARLHPSRRRVMPILHPQRQQRGICGSSSRPFVSSRPRALRLCTAPFTLVASSSTPRPQTPTPAPRHPPSSLHSFTFQLNLIHV